MAQTLAESFLADLDELSDDEPAQQDADDDAGDQGDDQVQTRGATRVMIAQ